jgi:Transglycosylase SLT domain
MPEGLVEFRDYFRRNYIHKEELHMESFELFMKEEHPPPRLSPFRALLRGTLFFVTFVLFFHFPIDLGTQYLLPGLLHFTGESGSREKSIREILNVLEKYPTGLANVTKEELAEVIYEEATRHNQDPKFIVAFIAIESSFKNWSVSERGAKGLMQIMPYVAQSLAQEMGIEWGGDRTLFNPFLNTRMGIYYLSRLLLDFEDLGIALTAYNYGPTYVKSLIEKKQQIPVHFYKRILTVYQDL